MDASLTGWISANRSKLTPSENALIEILHLTGPDTPCPIGLPVPAFRSTTMEVQFLIWSPYAVPPGTSVSISSSRLNQKLDQQSDWFDALRTIAVQISKEEKFLVTATSTTTYDLVCRVCQLFDIPLVEFKPFPKQPTRDWFDQVRQEAEQFVPSLPDLPACLHSEIRPARRARIFYQLIDSRISSTRRPNIDELLIQSATISVLLSVRKNGNIERAAQNRLEHAPKGSTRLLINRQLTSKQVETRLRDAGATAWWIYDPWEPETSPTPTITHRKQCVILSLDEVASENFLIHYTRRRVGPWPDQTQPEFLDDLIFQTGRKNHSEIAALCRILASRRILATNSLTRDRRPVVCFSEIPLSQIIQRRVFRPHLSRWDFEPFGIAIDRKLLETSGTRPVIYGNEQDWDELPDEDRPFFQLEKSKSEKIDWRSEHEWRKLGDVNLDQISPDQAVVFVNTESDADSVQALSRWPIVVLSTDNQCD